MSNCRLVASRQSASNAGRLSLPLAAGDLAQLALLVRRRLIDRAHAEIENSSFHRKPSQLCARSIARFVGQTYSFFEHACAIENGALSAGIRRTISEGLFIQLRSTTDSRRARLPVSTAGVIAAVFSGPPGFGLLPPPVALYDHVGERL